MLVRPSSDQSHTPCRGLHSTPSLAVVFHPEQEIVVLMASFRPDGVEQIFSGLCTIPIWRSSFRSVSGQALMAEVEHGPARPQNSGLRFK